MPSEIIYFDKERPEITAKIRELYDIWDRIRGEHSMPNRRDFNPTMAPKLLPYIFMDDVLYDPVRFRFRLVGTEIVDGIGEDPTGQMRKRNINESDSWERLLRVVEEKKPIVGLNLHFQNDRHYIPDYSCIHLPFGNDEGRVDIIMSMSDIHKAKQ